MLDRKNNVNYLTIEILVPTPGSNDFENSFVSQVISLVHLTGSLVKSNNNYLVSNIFFRVIKIVIINCREMNPEDEQN